MTYSGGTFNIDCSRGGLNHNKNLDEIPPEAMVHPSRNINLHEGGRKKRGGTSKVDAADMSGTPRLMGIYDFQMKNGNQFLLRVDTNGSIWKDDVTTLNTGWATGQKAEFVGTDDKVYITNGSDIPQTWDGDASTTEDLGSTGETAPTTITVALANVDGSVDDGTHRWKATFINAHGETVGGDVSNQLTVQGIATAGACTDDLAGDGVGNVDDGLHSYKITFVTATGETEGGTTSAGVTVADQATDGKVALTDIPLGASGTTSRKIYRTIAGDIGSHLLVDTLADNSTTEYEDDTADSGLGAAVPTTNTTDGQVSLTAIPTGPAGVTSRKIYRTVSGDTGDYKLVGSLGDNTTTTYTDNTADASLGASAPGTNTAHLRPTDWTGTNHPKAIVIHGRGASERGWAFGCPENIYTVYASKNGDFDDYSDTNVVAINIHTNDGFGIIGAVEFGDRLICFGKTKAYIIDDTSTSTANWGYQEVQWRGGAGSHRLIVRTPNDIMVMTEDGDVYSVAAVQSYGDYKAASLARPAFIDRWIREHARLSSIEDFHAVYDPKLRAIKWFIVRLGLTNIDTALVQFIDRPPAEAWMPHSNQSYTSGYSASCSTLYRNDVGDYQVYTGGYAGDVWRLETANSNDNNSPYYGGFKTPHSAYGNTRAKKKYKRGWAITEPKGNYVVYITPTLDGTTLTTRSISLSGSGVPLGTFLLGTDSLAQEELIDRPFDLRDVGKRMQLEVFNSGANEDFFISQLAIDHRVLGLDIAGTGAAAGSSGKTLSGEDI